MCYARLYTSIYPETYIPIKGSEEAGKNNMCKVLLIPSKTITHLTIFVLNNDPLP